MEQKIYLTLCLLIYTLFAVKAQTSCTSTPTADQHTIIIQSTASLLLDGSPLPIGSHIIALYNNNGTLQCAGSEQWNGANTALSAFGDDGGGNGFASNEVIKYRIELPNGCFTDNVFVTYASGGFYTHDSTFAINGISAIASLTASQASITSSITSTNVTCFGNNTGVIDLTASGGNSSTYSYTWSNGNTTEDLNNIAAGFYSYTVSDGCLQDTGSVMITQPTDLSINTNVSDALCFNNGNIAATVTGGTSPYTYQWSNNASTPTISNLQSGSYTLTVTDNNNCISMTSTLTVSGSPAPLTTTINETDVTCNGGNNGTATITTNGGTTPYTYAWSNGQTTNTATNLTANNYSVTVTDGNSCTSVNTITINEPIAVSATNTATDVSCNGGTDGTINLTVSGGTAPYTYAWSNGGTAQNPIGLSAGTYTCTITDANNCTFTTSNVTISEPILIEISDTIITHPTSNSGGSIDITPIGGTPPYQYSWSNNETTEDISNLNGATYTVTITDANGCTEQFSFELFPVSTNFFNQEDVFLKVFPNPAVSNSYLNITIEAESLDDFTVKVFDILGKEIQPVQLLQLMNQELASIELPNYKGWIIIKLLQEDREIKTFKVLLH